MLIFPLGTLLNIEDRSAGNTLGDPSPFIHFSNDRFGEKAGLTNSLFIPDRLNKWDGLILGLFSIRQVKTNRPINFLLPFFPFCGLDENE